MRVGLGDHDIGIRQDAVGPVYVRGVKLGTLLHALKVE